MNFGEEGRGYSMGRCQYKLGRRLFLDVLGLKSDIKNVLDVGCGLGEFGDMLTSSYGFRVTYVDGADHCIAYLKNAGKTCYQVDLEKEKLPFEDNSFDVVVSLEVIEHLWNTTHYLNEIRRVLVDDGVLIITTPNYNCWRRRVTSLFGRWEKLSYLSRHKKFYTAKSFKWELERYFSLHSAAGALYIPFLDGKMCVYRGLNLLACRVGIVCRRDAKDLVVGDVKEK